MDQTSRGELELSTEQGSVPLFDWMDAHGLKVIGRSYYAACMSDLPESEAPYILAGEAYNGEEAITINRNFTNPKFKVDHAEYTHYSVHLSRYGIAYDMDDFTEGDYPSRLNTECNLIFTMELIVLKITAIDTANKDIISAFADSDVSMNEILNISERFSLSLPLWDIGHFRYYLAQELANHIEEAFEVPYHIGEYEKNRSHLEQLIRVRSLIASEKESKALSVFATVLAAIQIIPLLFELILYILEGGVIRLNHLWAVSIPSSATVVIMLLLFVDRSNIKRKKQR
jgi:hypothetical protein